MARLGTHNSGTSGSLVWWQWLFTPIFQLVSRCQKLNIVEQLLRGVRVYNFQVTYYRGEWHFSHGLCIYREKLKNALKIFKRVKRLLPGDYKEPYYIQLYLDKNFFLGQNRSKFDSLVKEVLDHQKDGNYILLTAWIEGDKEYTYKSSTKINLVEKYWTTSWAKQFAKSWVDYLPLPKRHAKKYNKKYLEDYKDSDFLMLDFID